MPGCALRYCRNTSKNTAKSSGVTFHRFPRDPNGHRDAWISFVRADRSEPCWSPSEHTYLCSDHFRETDFTYTPTGRKFSRLSAIPSIPSQFHQSAPASTSSGDVNMETDDETVDNDKLDGVNTTEGNVQPAKAGQNPSGSGLILQAGSIPRVRCMHCSVFGCSNNVLNNPYKKFYSFPTLLERRNLWLELINRKDLASKQSPVSPHRVCSDHFDLEDYTSDRILKDTAAPKRDLPLRSVHFTYDNNDGAGLSGSQERQLKHQVVHTPQVKIQYEPKTKAQINNTVINQEPPTPNTTGLDCLAVSDPFTLCGELQRKLSKRENFLQRAMISPVEHVYLPGQPPDIHSVYVQTTKPLLEYLIAPLRKEQEADFRVVKRKIRACEKKMQRHASTQISKKEFQQSCDLYLDNKFSNLVKFHLNMSNKVGGNRYSRDFKTLVLSLYFSSPRSYKFLEKLLHLPSRATTIRTQIPMKTGINTVFLEYFKAKVRKMSATEKICSVYFDHIKLSKNLHYCINNDFLYGLHDIDQFIGSEPAGYATLLMVKGLYSDWQQPISFAYLAEKTFYTELKAWLFKIIALLFNIGLNVKAFVMNLGTEFLQFPEVSIAEPYFEVSGRKIYQIFDVPALFKSAREALVTHDFHIGEKCVKWSHIVKVYYNDKDQMLRLVPKLTESHLCPEENDDPVLAIQVFSRAVAAAMNYHVIAKLINSNALGTVEFIKTMNNLFDILTSQKITHENELKRAYTNTGSQKDCLKNTFEYLKRLEIRDRKGNTVNDSASFIIGLLITIKSVMSLSEELQQENFNYLLTKHFSLDCMKLYFKKVRKLGGNCCATPTAVMFARSFRRLFLASLVSNTTGGSVMDLKSTLTRISEYVKTNDAKKEEAEPSYRFLKCVGGDCLKMWKMRSKPDTVFTAGYFLSKCLDKHRCQKLLESLCNQYNYDVKDAELLVQKFKEYNSSNPHKTDLVPPPDFMVDAVLRMEKIFNDYIKKNTKSMYSLGWNVYQIMETEVFEMSCDCFPLMNLKQLCIRNNIYYKARHYNSNVKPPKKIKKKKNKGK